MKAEEIWIENNSNEYRALISALMELSESHHQSQLQALKEKVRKLHIDRPCDEEDEGRNQAIGIVLNLITNLEDNG